MQEELELRLLFHKLSLGYAFAHRRSGRNTTSDGHEHIVNVLGTTPLQNRASSALSVEIRS
jgi:hypothetical protein